jgi:Xaa-Pro aminopeptidase
MTSGENDIVLVTESGCEPLTPYPYDPRLI